jgi:hypothetical protein
MLKGGYGASVWSFGDSGKNALEVQRIGRAALSEVMYGGKEHGDGLILFYWLQLLSYWIIYRVVVVFASVHNGIPQGRVP